MMAALHAVALVALVDGGITPDAHPGPDGSAAPVAPAGKPSLPDAAVSAVSTADRVVALTFDACATMRQANGFDRQVFDILIAERVPATFFLAGRWVEKHEAAAQLIAQAPLIELGNHSYSHPRLTLVSDDSLTMQIRRTDQILEKTLGRKPLSLRPPAGAWDADVVRAAAAEGLPVVTWTVVSGDVGGHVPAARMVKTVLEQARPGAIIIFHINRREPYTKQALPAIIAGLRERGFRFVTVSELLALPGAVPEHAKPSHWGFGMRKQPRLAEPTDVAAEPPPPAQANAVPAEPATPHPWCAASQPPPAARGEVSGQTTAAPHRGGSDAATAP